MTLRRWSNIHVFLWKLTHINSCKIWWASCNTGSTTNYLLSLPRKRVTRSIRKKPSPIPFHAAATSCPIAWQPCYLSTVLPHFPLLLLRVHPFPFIHTCKELLMFIFLPHHSKLKVINTTVKFVLQRSFRRPEVVLLRCVWLILTFLIFCCGKSTTSGARLGAHVWRVPSLFLHLWPEWRIFCIGVCQ